MSHSSQRFIFKLDDSDFYIKLIRAYEKIKKNYWKV